MGLFVCPECDTVFLVQMAQCVREEFQPTEIECDRFDRCCVENVASLFLCLPEAEGDMNHGLSVRGRPKASDSRARRSGCGGIVALCEEAGIWEDVDN